MENFLNKNISLVNKNNCINIKLGKHIDNCIFDYTMSKKKFYSFITECSKDGIHFTKGDKLCQYKILDFCIELNKNKIKYITYKTKDFLIDEKDKYNILITLDNKEISNSNIVSNYNYNSITWIQEYIYNYNNIYSIILKDNIEIDNNNNIKKQYFSLIINIKKSYNNIFKYLNKIIDIYCTC